MGCVPCTERRGGKTTQKSHSSTASEISPLKSDTYISWTIESKIALKAGCSFGQPLLYSKNEILFLSSGHNQIIITSYNTKTKKYNKPQEIYCNSFDIQQCEYTFDPKSRNIYFIHNNERIITLNLNTNEIISNEYIHFNKNNYSHIEKHKDKTYIMGATSNKDEFENKSNDNFTFVPYDAYKSFNQQQTPLQYGFGNRAITINVTQKKRNYIYIMGGEKQYSLSEQKEPIHAPCDTIWILDLSLIHESGLTYVNKACKWTNRFLFGSMTSFGIINYRDKYLITFGGFRFFRPPKEKFAVSNEIHILDLTDDGKWYRLKKRLQSKCGYFALYDNNNKADVVHLFGYNGRYYTLKIKDIINAFDNKQYAPLRPWTEQGKTVLPTKSKSIRNMGPKIEDDDDDDD